MLPLHSFAVVVSAYSSLSVGGVVLAPTGFHGVRSGQPASLSTYPNASISAMFKKLLRFQKAAEMNTYRPLIM